MIRKAQRDKLVLENQGLVISVAKKYAKAGVDFLDLVQEGNLGMVIATRKYDPKRPTKFSTMATWWIKKYIREAVMKKHTVHIPFNVQLNDSKKIRERAKLHARYGEDFLSGISSNLEFTQELEDSGYRQDYDEKIDRERKFDRMNVAFELVLNKREQEVLNLYLDGKGPKEIRKELVALEMGIDVSKLKKKDVEQNQVSKQRISQMYNKATKKLAGEVTSKRKSYNPPAFIQSPVQKFLSNYYPHLQQPPV